jgi:hypothetical protein
MLIIESQSPGARSGDECYYLKLDAYPPRPSKKLGRGGRMEPMQSGRRLRHLPTTKRCPAFWLYTFPSSPMDRGV